MIPKYMIAKITNEKEAQKFICDLYFDDHLYHFASPASEIISFKTGKPAFTDIECQLLDQRVSEVFEHIEDPFTLCLALVDPKALS